MDADLSVSGSFSFLACHDRDRSVRKLRRRGPQFSRRVAALVAAFAGNRSGRREQVAIATGTANGEANAECPVRFAHPWDRISRPNTQLLHFILPKRAKSKDIALRDGFVVWLRFKTYVYLLERRVNYFIRDLGIGSIIGAMLVTLTKRCTVERVHCEITCNVPRVHAGSDGHPCAG